MLRSRIAPATWREGTRRTSTATCGCAAANRSTCGSRLWTAASLAPTMTRPRRICCSSWTAVCASLARPEQPLGVVLEEPARLGQRAVPRGPVEQPLPQLVLDPAHRLADGRLGPVEAPGGGRKAPIRRHGKECGEVGELHKLPLILTKKL